MIFQTGPIPTAAYSGISLLTILDLLASGFSRHRSPLQAAEVPARVHPGTISGFLGSFAGRIPDLYSGHQDPILSTSGLD